MFGRNDFLGEVMLPMTDQQLDDQSPKWYSLSERVSCEKDLNLGRHCPLETFSVASLKLGAKVLSLVTTLTRRKKCLKTFLSHCFESLIILNW